MKTVLDVMEEEKRLKEELAEIFPDLDPEWVLHELLSRREKAIRENAKIAGLMLPEIMRSGIWGGEERCQSQRLLKKN